MSDADHAELQARIEELEAQVVEVEIDRDAHKATLQSIAKLTESEMRMGRPCRLCHHSRTHAPTCYVRSGTGYDLLEEHEATLRENAELRAALAKHLPVNGKAILAGAEYKSHRTRLRDRIKRRRQTPPS